ncbi:putative kinetochore protein [Sparassis crispa]|uniref:Kinetochore protein Spc24 n=1 Tax=Sparassis crispa TaxID=139825 RepID=A0A401GJQ7_9APHY|nr:putative kinetochore protein [Sparassis crispa]GBE82407.1 putative kinetochore protein [Sparassis crispa]
MDPGEDYLTIAAAEEQMILTRDERQKDLEDAHAKMRSLARVLEAARVSSTRPSTVPSVEAHARTLNDLDATRLQLAKAINDAEGALASKEAELARLKDEARALEEADSAAEHDLDATALRLAMYKGLGFEPVMDKEGHVSKMLIRMPFPSLQVLYGFSSVIQRTQGQNRATFTA